MDGKAATEKAAFFLSDKKRQKSLLVHSPELKRCGADRISECRDKMTGIRETGPKSDIPDIQHRAGDKKLFCLADTESGQILVYGAV